jgi:hypothetical protein
VPRLVITCAPQGWTAATFGARATTAKAGSAATSRSRGTRCARSTLAARASARTCGHSRSQTHRSASGLEGFEVAAFCRLYRRALFIAEEGSAVAHTLVQSSVCAWLCWGGSCSSGFEGIGLLGLGSGKIGVVRAPLAHGCPWRLSSLSGGLGSFSVTTLLLSCLGIGGGGCDCMSVSSASVRAGGRECQGVCTVCPQAVSGAHKRVVLKGKPAPAVATPAGSGRGVAARNLKAERRKTAPAAPFTRVCSEDVQQSGVRFKQCGPGACAAGEPREPWRASVTVGGCAFQPSGQAECQAIGQRAPRAASVGRLWSIYGVRACARAGRLPHRQPREGAHAREGDTQYTGCLRDVRALHWLPT